MKTLSRKQHAFLTVEVLVTLAVLIMLWGLLMETMLQAGRTNRAQWARQTCIEAVQAQLDCLTALGKPLPEEDCRRLWPNIHLTVQLRPAEGIWSGLTCAAVQAEQRIFRKTIRIQQTRYLMLPPENPE
jgi:type II secretory pathway pseudopilin PulG